MEKITMTGLKTLQAFAEHKLNQSSISQTISIEEVEIVSGCMTFTAKLSQQKESSYLQASCGFIMTLLDIATEYTAQTILMIGKSAILEDINIKMCQPFLNHTEVMVEAKIVNHGRSRIILESFVRGPQGEVYAYAQAIHKIMSPEQMLLI